MQTYSVSRETYNELKLYQQSLDEWQQKFNLVSNSSLENAWKRHFEDSAQLFRLLPESAVSLVDMGAGAGFPGMVLAIMGKAKTPYLNVTLVESIAKKTLFLQHVKEITGTNVEIVNQRIENLSGRKFDVVTARAVTSLDKLFDYAYPLMHKKSVCIFSKGESYRDELAAAATKWSFICKEVPSVTNPQSVILKIYNLTKRGRK